MTKQKNKNIKKQISKKSGGDEVKDKIITSLKILVGVLIIVLLTVLITKIANGDFKSKEKDNSYDEIIAGQIFNRPDETYYVLIYSYKEDESINTYLEELTKTKIYKVNLDDKINSSIIGSENITNDVTKLKIENPVILKIENKEIVETIKEDDIPMYLNDLSYQEGIEE